MLEPFLLSFKIGGSGHSIQMKLEFFEYLFERLKFFDFRNRLIIVDKCKALLFSKNLSSINLMLPDIINDYKSEYTKKVLFEDEFYLDDLDYFLFQLKKEDVHREFPVLKKEVSYILTNL